MISKYINYHEGTHSETAVNKNIVNQPTVEILDAMRYVAANVFDKVREKLGALRVNCFYRCLELNKAVGGAPTSQHTKGEAIDISGLNGVKNSAIFNFIKENLEFDQLIAENITNGEPKWIHVSLKKGNNRNQILIAIPKKAGGWKYEPYTKGKVNE